jgi:hypothetical protein
MCAIFLVHKWLLSTVQEVLQRWFKKQTKIYIFARRNITPKKIDVNEK